MSNFKQSLILLSMLIITVELFAITPLTMENAEVIAYNNSNLAKESSLLSQSYEHQAEAVGEYSDPQLNFGMFNLPADDFSITGNPTTQLRVGIKQKLPRGDILEFKKAEKDKLSTLQKHKAKTILMSVVKQTRLSYLDIFKAGMIRKVLLKQQHNFAQLKVVTEQKFANGLASQQDVISAKLQLAKIDDQILKQEYLMQQNIRKLSRWIGSAARREKTQVFPILPRLKNLNTQLLIDW